MAPTIPGLMVPALACHEAVALVVASFEFSVPPGRSLRGDHRPETAGESNLTPKVSEVDATLCPTVIAEGGQPMAMPDVLALVRHGESVGNVANRHDRHGDLSLFTVEFRQIPDSRWQLTDTGRAQAQITGAWLRRHVPGFDLFYVSPYARTMETAAALGFSDARWRLNRALRERDHGDVGSIPSGEIADTPWWSANAATAARDPLYWSPPNGESIADVAENRVRNVLDTLHRDADSKRVLLVTHGETMLAFRLVLERLDDQQFVMLVRDPSERIANCGVVLYSRLNPHSGERDRQLRWIRSASPTRTGDDWSIRASGWRRFDLTTLSDSDLLTRAADLTE